MRATTHGPRTIELGHEQLLSIDGRGQRVRVLCGAAWLTQEGEAGDAVLSPGAEVVLHGGRVLIQALGATRVQVVGGAAPGAAAAATALRRVRRWAVRLQFGPALPEPAV